jgi:signal transduction histidine kinase/cell division protein FtsB
MILNKFKKFFNKESIIQLTLLKIILIFVIFLIIFLIIFGKNYWEKQTLKENYLLLSVLANTQMMIASEFSEIKLIKEDINLSKEQKIEKLTSIIKPLINKNNNDAVSFYDIELNSSIKNSNKLFGNNNLIIGTKESVHDLNYSNMYLPIYDKDELIGYIWAYAPNENYIFASFNETSIFFILILTLSLLIMFLIRKYIQQIELYLNKYCKMIIGDTVSDEQDQIMVKLPELKPILDKIAFYIEDLKLVNLELESSRFKINKILEGISDGFYLLDCNWKFELINNKTKKIINAEDTELIGKNIWMVYPQLINSLTYYKMMEAVETNESVRWEAEGFTASGQFFRYRAYPLKEGLAVFFRDITELRRQKQEINRLERLNLIGQLAAGISHEIRNPMTTIKGFLQIFGSKSKYEEDKENIDLMISEVDRANGIITDFLSLAKANLDNDKPQNINVIIKRILPMLQADAYNNDKEVVIDLNEVPDLLINENEIKQLVLNLVRNGLEATPKQDSVIISTYLEEDKVVLAIKDHGPGIPEEIKEKIGTPFFTTKETGTGLGLAISMGIARRHKANFLFETGENGTVFYVIFPIF